MVSQFSLFSPSCRWFVVGCSVLGRFLTFLISITGLNWRGYQRTSAGKLPLVRLPLSLWIRIEEVWFKIVDALWWRAQTQGTPPQSVMREGGRSIFWTRYKKKNSKIKLRLIYYICSFLVRFRSIIIPLRKKISSNASYGHDKMHGNNWNWWSSLFRNFLPW